MKQSILSDDPISFEKTIRNRTMLAICLVLATLCINVVLTSMRTDSNHTLFLILNIASDILCGLFLLPFVALRILPQKKLLNLMRKEKENLQATVLEISRQSRRYMDIDCLTITTENRTLFLPVHTMNLQEGTVCRFYLVQNIIVEAEQ